MITGEIRINDTLTLMKWEAVNIGCNPFNTAQTLYYVTVKGINTQHTPYWDEFEVVKFDTEPMPVLVNEIMNKTIERESHNRYYNPALDID